MTIAYTTGQITLTNGSAVVTGIGTAWAVSLIAGGMIAAEAGGNLLPIESVDSDTSITASIEWKGATGTYDYALVRDTAYLQQLNLNSNTLARLIAELDAGTIFKYDASGDLAGRATYDERQKGFSYLVFIGVDEPSLYVKATSADGDWDGPFAYGTGPEGPIGPAGYVNFRGVYAGATSYARNDGVLYNGSSFVALQDTVGNAPPTLPAPSNAYWQLLAIKGTDGSGTGDVVGPAGATDDTPAFFDGTTGKLVKSKTKAQFKTWLAATALDVSFDNSVANLTGNPTTVQAAINAIGNSGGKNDALFALEIADLKGVKMGMVGGVADSFDDETGIQSKTNATYDAANDWYSPTLSAGNVTDLLHFDGANGSTSILNATGSKAWVRGGDAQISTAQSKFGGASLLLDGTGDYVAATTGLSDYAYGTGDFTFDIWVRPANLTGQQFIFDLRGGAANNPCLYLASGVPGFYAAGGVRITGGAALTAGVWSHVAVSRVSGVTRLFVNGVQSGANYADTNNYVAPTTIYVGVDSSGSTAFNGNFDEMRIAKQGFYSTGFTPETAAYALPFANMTLVSVDYAASAVPTTARAAVQLADALALIAGTDFTLEVSRDAGTTYTAVTLALSMPPFGGVKMYEGTASISGQPPGSTMKWRFKTLTNKNVVASGVVLQQS